jgi:sugar phosphate permease
MKNESVKKAISLGVLCAVAYFAVYIARNTLGAVAPKTGFSEAFLGKTSSVYFVSYAVGQLINGVIGDRIKARNMISFGLLFAGVTNLGFMFLAPVNEFAALVAYAMTGFFLAMIYAPMSKLVAENTEPHYAARCSLGYTFSSLFGSPTAGLIAAVAVYWQISFYVSSFAMIGMAVVCFFCFLLFEKKGYVKYGQYAGAVKGARGGTVGVLIRHDIIRFTLIAVITGVVRTSVVFWLPTYFAGHLGYSSDTSAMIFTVTTLIISFSAFLSIFVYELLGRRMLLNTLLMFSLATIFFFLTFLIHASLLNVILITLAVLFSNAAANMIWSVYCPSLRDTGRVSSATGFLDFSSYMAAAVSSSLFATAATTIGWGPLILIWCGLMVCGLIVSLPFIPFGAKKG